MSFENSRINSSSPPPNYNSVCVETTVRSDENSTAPLLSVDLRPYMPPAYTCLFPDSSRSCSDALFGPRENEQKKCRVGLCIYLLLVGICSVTLIGIQIENLIIDSDELYLKFSNDLKGFNDFLFYLLDWKESNGKL